ncbi:MAG TPA: polymorphic toxin type 28 domain-containing protein [Candidatus Limnocylindrales bacterium]
MAAKRVSTANIMEQAENLGLLDALKRLIRQGKKLDDISLDDVRAAARKSDLDGTPRIPSKTDRMKEHLTERDLDAARREAAGEVVARKPDGTPWDHVDEVRNAQRGLNNRIDQLKRQMGDTRLSDAERAAVQDELTEASKLLDHSKGYLPWPP